MTALEEVTEILALFAASSPLKANALFEAASQCDAAALHELFVQLSLDAGSRPVEAPEAPEPAQSGVPLFLGRNGDIPNPAAFKHDERGNRTSPKYQTAFPRRAEPLRSGSHWSS
jgi:hypothetical protein